MDRTDFAMKMAQFVADAPDYGVSRETLDALNDFSCKVERLKHDLSVLSVLTWNGTMEGDEKAGEQAAHLSETLLEIVTIRDKEISQIISTIHPLIFPPLE
ncbi:hypothetical protein [Lawsonibacter sp. JLR.KK007]|jgi:hypothetical protein|uniref:hypothetical protein n=1 Tax=Lawsonibacter sp. JLR.KK007 TaxID=3114293 RepID=UPI002FF13B66